MKKDLNCNVKGTKFLFKNKIPYTSIPKYFLIDQKLSLKAKGLLAILYSLPEEWDYSVKGLCNITACGEKQITSTLKELIETHYIERLCRKDKRGRFYWEYIIDLAPKTYYLNKDIFD